MGVHVCNPSYSRGGARRVKVQGQPEQKSELSEMVHAYNPRYLGGRGRKIKVQGWPRQKHKHN
jgi:hypothetical protein